jgi:hypothetical protein
VETFGQQGNVLVREGQFTTVSLSMQSFVPQFTGGPDQVAAGQDFTVEWNAVPGGVSYDLVVATDPDFGSVIRSENTDGTELTLALGDPGPHYFRVRARNEFNSIGVFSDVSPVVDIFASPFVQEHTLEFAPATPETCPESFQAFAMIERVGYSDPGGNFPSSDFTETGDRIESQLRDQGESAWESVVDGRFWSVTDGSDGSSGEISSGICFRGRDEADFIDFRVRVKSSDGLESPWDEMRLWLPKTVEATERQDLGFDETVQLEAMAFDVNGDMVPGDPFTWSNFNLGVGLVEPDGTYTTRDSGGGGLDQVYARAGYAWMNIPIQGPEATRFRSWWAPCWSFDPGFALPMGTFRPFRIHAYVGQEYLIELGDPTDGSEPDGNAALYLRSDEAPTRDDYDDRATSTDWRASLSFLADRDHTLWFAVEAVTDIVNVRLEVTTTDDLCGYPGTGIDPSATGAPAAQAATILSPARIRSLLSARRSPAALGTAPAPDGAHGSSAGGPRDATLLRNGG